MITFELPIHTVSEANKREHWAIKAKRVKEQRGMVSAKLKTILKNIDNWDLRRTVVLTRIAPRLLDDDNIRGAMKAIRDGVADVICENKNDRDPRITWEYKQEKRKPKEYEIRVEII